MWSADPGVDLFAEPVAVVRAAVEAKAVADMVGRANTYPRYDRFLSAGTETVQGKGDIHVEDAPSFEEPIALAGTKHYRLYDVTLSDTAVDTRVCEIAFGTYQPDPKHARKHYEPALPHGSHRNQRHCLPDQSSGRGIRASHAAMPRLDTRPGRLGLCSSRRFLSAVARTETGAAMSHTDENRLINEC